MFIFFFFFLEKFLRWVKCVTEMPLILFCFVFFYFPTFVSSWTFLKIQQNNKHLFMRMQKHVIGGSHGIQRTVVNEGIFCHFCNSNRTLFCSFCRSFCMSCFYFLGNMLRKHTRDGKSLESHRESQKKRERKRLRRFVTA